MDISVTRFRAGCLDLIRRVQTSGEPVDIRRRGKVVARLVPPPPAGKAAHKPWEVLRGSGQLLAAADESVIDEGDFKAGHPQGASRDPLASRLGSSEQD